MSFINTKGESRLINRSRAFGIDQILAFLGVIRLRTYISLLSGGDADAPKGEGLSRVVSEWQSHMQKQGFWALRPSSPAWTSLSVHGRPLPPATWKPFVLNQPPSSPQPIPRTREEGGSGDPTHSHQGPKATIRSWARNSFQRLN